MLQPATEHFVRGESGAEHFDEDAADVRALDGSLECHLGTAELLFGLRTGDVALQHRACVKMK